ncbi:ferredoxin [Nocardia heshunensis]
MSTPQRLHIDWTRCDGRGVCAELLPDLIARDDWGYPLTRDHRDPVPSPAELPTAREAVRLCPRLALKLLPLA